MERKHTKFEVCPAHRPFFAGETRYRKAEVFGEGGPYNGSQCTDGGCRISPGRDLFVASLCSATYDTFTGPFAWDANQ